MKLHGKSRNVFIGNPLTAAVIHIDMGDGSHILWNALNGVAVVLAGNKDPILG